MSSLGCFQSFESFDGGLGPHFLKLSGLALFAAMVLLRLSVLHWYLDGEFFRLHLVSEKILVIGTLKGRNEGKGVLVQPSAILCRLRFLQVCSLSVAAVAAAFAFLEVKLVAAAMAAAFAAAFGYLFVETTACGFTLGAHFTLVDCLMFGILVFIICDFAGFFWTFGKCSLVTSGKWACSGTSGSVCMHHCVSGACS